MIIKTVEIERFRAFESVSFDLGKRVTAISGRNATQKTTVLGMIGQPFTISSKDNPMYGCKTIDGYNFRSQFKEKFKLSPTHDIIGEHKWKLLLHNRVHEQNYYSVESIARSQSGKKTTLRFWNAESKARGAGYIQLPVYFLSLSRLFPIGEGGKTRAIAPELSATELQYCIDNYRSILSIQNVDGTSAVGLEKGTTSKVFSGVSDNTHDIFSNSAGEGNITRIIIAVLSFKRLQEQYGRDYTGGILLIDELDATLYSFSQKKLVDYLWNAAGEFKIQVVFTTHSPIILQSVNKLQRIERQRKGITLPTYAYDSTIVYLEPHYDDNGKRTIVPQNISTSSELSGIVSDINLSFPTSGAKLNIYCEDLLAISFLKYVLSNALKINLDLYMCFIEIDLGWTNYIQLVNKKIPEFKNNPIILDGDVTQDPNYGEKANIVADAGNILFLPLVIEKGLFCLLKNHAAYSRFQASSPRAQALNYDICFNEWPLDENSYKSIDFKHWYKQAKEALGDPNILFDFWCSENHQAVDTFVEQFIRVFNLLAERNAVDALPPSEPQQQILTNETNS